MGGHKGGRGETDARIDRVTSAPAHPPQGKQGQTADRGEQGQGAGQPKFQRVLQIGVVGSRIKAAEAGVPVKPEDLVEGSVTGSEQGSRFDRLQGQLVNPRTLFILDERLCQPLIGDVATQGEEKRAGNDHQAGHEDGEPQLHLPRQAKGQAQHKQANGGADKAPAGMGEQKGHRNDDPGDQETPCPWCNALEQPPEPLPPSRIDAEILRDDLQQQPACANEGQARVRGV